MLRIVRRTRHCMRIAVWCLLISVNVLMGVGIILNFLKCDGTGLTVSPKQMWCWSNIIAANYNLFSAVDRPGEHSLGALTCSLKANLAETAEDNGTRCPVP
ncbi:hypothetical protein F5883DRAFT_525707 [Diaporthe sp. PMI_573]|nr:hypothetical protein F5883DRAFT_525707 [Diaporthaceae sp. PMI_573]